MIWRKQLQFEKGRETEEVSHRRIRKQKDISMWIRKRGSDSPDLKSRLGKRGGDYNLCLFWLKKKKKRPTLRVSS